MALKYFKKVVDVRFPSWYSMNNFIKAVKRRVHDWIWQRELQYGEKECSERYGRWPLSLVR